MCPAALYIERHAQEVDTFGWLQEAGPFPARRAALHYTCLGSLCGDGPRQGATRSVEVSVFCEESAVDPPCRVAAPFVGPEPFVFSFVVKNS